jgi:hypothetical protein
MSQEPDAEMVRAVMSSLGRRTSEKKKASGLLNTKKATAASQTPEARENRRRAQVERWERWRAEKQATEKQPGEAANG